MNRPYDHARPGLRASLLGGALSLLSACAAADTPPSAPASGKQIDRCKLLAAAEVEAAIGPHDGGHAGSGDRPTQWGQDSCRWTATQAREVQGWPDGWHDAIEVAVFHPYRDGWAREQAEGDPVDGFPAGALFDASSGELWFACGERFCALKVHTASAAARAQIARELGGQVLRRVP